MECAMARRRVRWSAAPTMTPAIAAGAEAASPASQAVAATAITTAATGPGRRGRNPRHQPATSPKATLPAISIEQTPDRGERQRGQGEGVVDLAAGHRVQQVGQRDPADVEDLLGILRGGHLGVELAEEKVHPGSEQTRVRADRTERSEGTGWPTQLLAELVA